MRVDDVVHHTPSDSTDVHREGDRPIHSTGDSGPSKECAPVERKTWISARDNKHTKGRLAEDDLRVICDSLHEWIDHHEAER